MVVHDYLIAVMAFITENWRLSAISAAKTSRTVRTLISNEKLLLTYVN